MIVFGVIALMGGLHPDQPDLAVRPVQGGGRLGRQPARLVRHVPRRVDPSDAGLGHRTVLGPVHDPGDLLAHGGAARHPDHAADVLSVHRGPAAQGPAVAPPAAAPARRAGPDRAGRHGDRVLRRAADLRRQRRDRRQVRHQPERDDLGRPDRHPGRPADRVLRDLPDLPGPAAARPRGAGPRRGDGHHQAPAERPVRRGAPAAGGQRQRPRRAGVRRRPGAEEDEPARRGRAGGAGLLLPDREGRPAASRRRPRPISPATSPQELEETRPQH